MKTTPVILEKVITNLHQCYNSEWQNFYEIGQQLLRKEIKEGTVRAAAGKLVESLLQNIFDTINHEIPTANIESKVGSSDYLSKVVVYKGVEYSFNTIQVDRHVLSNGKRIAFIENKTYLDSCYYDRALSDFRKIAQSLNQHNEDPADVIYAVFAGQNATKQNTLEVYGIDFYDITKHLTNNPDGIMPKVCFFLNDRRNSSRPWYEIQFDLNDEEVKKFVELIIDKI